MVELTVEQSRAADAIEEFTRSSSLGFGQARSHFTLHGLAGTGKTVMLSEVARRTRGAVLITPTGKAASVLRRRSGLDVRTVHSLIYDFKGLAEEDEDGRRDPIFVDKEGLDLRRRVVLLDECSMVGRRLATALLATGAIIVASGDPGQLPPVMDEAFFTEADVELTEVHRQALESPIIRQAHSVRHRGFYEPDGDAFQVVGFGSEELICGADITLCYTNHTRRALNAKKRGCLGLSGPLKEGEPVMCLKNAHARGVWNGAVYRLTADRRFGEPLRLADDDGRAIYVPRATVEGERDFDVKRRGDTYIPFAPAYAATVHKSQGSEWNSVLLFDEVRGVERVPFLYTGITRAVESCTVVSWR